MPNAREVCQQRRYDAVVVGSGPNGLAAAITLARAGREVLVVEGGRAPGGGMRSAPLTLPGFIHDVCSAVHPLGLASPFFRRLDLARHGLEWILPPIQVAHPLDREPAVLVYRSLEETADGLGLDGTSYRSLLEGPVQRWPEILDAILGPLRLPPNPLVLARFGLEAVQSASGLARRTFRGEQARALLAGAAAHSEQPLSLPTTAGTGLLLLILAHAVGWPVARGGSQAISSALVAELTAHGGEIVLDCAVTSLSSLPERAMTLLDLDPGQVLRLLGTRLPPGYRRQLQRFRYGPGAFKIDYALAGPIPWRDSRVNRAGTVHVGGTLAEIAAAERAVARGQHADRPYVLLAQQSAIDPTRAPDGRHTGWAYCHVPNGSDVDMTGAIEGQIERFAPGFTDLILARHITRPADFAAYNPNYTGGDINGGAMIPTQVYTRPALALNPYRLPAPGYYLCSASTPPAGGVHGMCGYWAARTALGDGW